MLVMIAAPMSVFAADTTVAKSATASVAKTDKDSDQSASERRAQSSSFEREKLDGDAFATSDDSAKSGSSKDSGGGSMLRFVFGLIVVIGVIYGVHWLLKRWGQSRMQGVVGTSGVIDVVATTPLAQGRSLHVVRVGNELVLVGATEQSITRIADLNVSALEAQTVDVGGGGFQVMLTGAMHGARPALPAGLPSDGSSKEPFVKRFIDNLRLTTAR